MTIRTLLIAAVVGIVGPSSAWAQSVATRTASPPPVTPGFNGHVINLPGSILRAPSLSDSGAYVSQIGDGNRAAVTGHQGSTQTFAAIVQSGQDNDAMIDQDGAHQFAEVIQAGQTNVASVIQDGDAQNTAKVVQLGSHNQAAVNQTVLASANAALILQAGIGNKIKLTQNGSNNSALLGQEGFGNEMEVEQFGDNNALTWNQLGSNLSGPTVTMEGNRSMTILQTGLR